MARPLVRGLCFAVLGAAFVIEGCNRPSPATVDRSLHAVAAQAAAADQAASPATHYELKASERLPTPSAPPPAQYPTEDPPPWLAEMLQSPDPNVRIQGLDAWAQHPSTSLDPVTYALVDPDERVRSRGQEIFEQELARR